MPNFSRGAFGRRSGTVTVIEEPVRRAAARTAKIVACVTFVAVTLLAAPVLSSRFHPITALFAGALIGLAAAFVAGSFMIIWPVLRVIWWWSIEITTAAALVVGWVHLSEHTLLPYRLVAVALLGGVPAVIPPVRRRVVAVAWCVITRHRLRTCFSEFIITNRSGSLPLISWARPTSVGERVWIWLRPGLCLEDIQGRLDQIAVACWASGATAEAASRTNAAYIRLDIKRRDALTRTVAAPLPGLVSADTPGIERDAIPVPTALDLPDVAVADVSPRRPARTDRKSPAPVPVIVPRPGETAGDEPEWKDWV